MVTGHRHRPQPHNATLGGHRRGSTIQLQSSRKTDAGHLWLPTTGLQQSPEAFRIYRREPMRWSVQGRAWMPLAQCFYGGYAMHEHRSVPAYQALTWLRADPFDRLARRLAGRQDRHARVDGPMMGVPGLELCGLRRSFGGLVAVDGLNFSVRAGEMFGFFGRNGAGKTTDVGSRMIAVLLAGVMIGSNPIANALALLRRLSPRRDGLQLGTLGIRRWLGSSGQR